ncbi:MAG: hypothetical protein IPK93_05735 [Solirubrobacterales bacterium]|nr:hypothetical protein [Solirubrobacterales bacterium]
MPLSPEQALDESTHRKVEGAFDELQRAARNIEREALAIEDEGGEQRLADLLRSVSVELRVKLKETMATAYYRPLSEADRIAQRHGLWCREPNQKRVRKRSRSPSSTNPEKTLAPHKPGWLFQQKRSRQT